MTEHHSSLPPKLAKANLSPEMTELVNKAKKLYHDKLAYFCQDSHHPPAYIATAPGRVNLIGEHTDYTGGFVLPLAISMSTVVYGTGFVHMAKGTGKSTVRVRLVSDKGRQIEIDDDNNSNDDDDVFVEERRFSSADHFRPPEESEPRSWVNYVVGTIVQYMPDLPEEGCEVDLAMAFCSNVPLGAGLSSSASLELATATFLENFLKDNVAYSSVPHVVDVPLERALRCQKAENEWAHSPCGIMDQFVSSGAKEGHLMLIDCRSLEVVHVPMEKATAPAAANNTNASLQQPVILVTNSKVTHGIADGEYGLRRAQCNDALTAMQQVPLYHVLSLRDATLQDVKDAKEKMDTVSYHRAKHVVTENQRTKECKTALKLGVWERVGELMNASHKSLRDDFEVSCEEVDFLVDVAQKHEGVYGSRMTGGGFGGSIVSLVQKEHVKNLIQHLEVAYKEKTGKVCDSYTTTPGPGARTLAIDMDCKAEK